MQNNDNKIFPLRFDEVYMYLSVLLSSLCTNNLIRIIFLWLCMISKHHNVEGTMHTLY